MDFTKFTNAFGTITVILASVQAFMVSIGCSAGATDFAATCAVPWLPASLVPIAAGVFGAITFILKMSRPGGFLHSMFGSTAVINKSGDPGTVTPSQVASGK
jgi:hypothetical protein